MYTTMMYRGGVYRSKEINDLIDDLGGFVIQKNVVENELVMIVAIPEEDTDKLREKARELLSEVKIVPLGGTEIAIVAPSLSPHHVPHPTCDIAEYLRREGSKVNLIGLARGVGRRIAQLTEQEKRLIEEHDAAVFIFGCLKDCIVNIKAKLLADLTIPAVVTGTPQLKKEEVPYPVTYIEGIGRIPRRFRRGEEIQALQRVVDALGQCIKSRKKELADDPPVVSPIYIKKEIEKQVSAIKTVTSPAPIVVKLDGLRLKLPYNEYAREIADIKIYGEVKLSDVANVKKSLMRDYILIKSLPESAMGVRL